MREIEFRGMTEDKRWVYGSLIKHGRYCCILEHDEDDMRFPYLDAEIGTIDGYATPVIPETVGQYTGLLDKNGRRVFEGDILRETNEYSGKGLVRAVKYEMSCGSCCTQVIGFGASGDGHTDFIILTDDFEVIGNIHDNPELVERD